MSFISWRLTLPPINTEASCISSETKIHDKPIIGFIMAIDVADPIGLLLDPSGSFDG
jgi:hypothetical protein